MNSTSGSHHTGVTSFTLHALLAGLVLSGLVACAQRVDSSSADGPTRLTIGPTMGSAGIGEVVSFLTKEGLIRPRPDGGHEPLLATEWHTMDDGDGDRILSLSLREDVAFHDGSTFDAAAVKQFLDAALNDRRARQLYPGLKDIERVDVRDAFHLDVRYRQSGFLLDALTMGIPSPSDDDMGTGPFTLVERTASTATLEANRSYRRGPPLVDVVSLVVYQGLRTAWAAMMRGEVDVLYEVPTSAREFVEEESSVELYPFHRPYAFLVGFNHDRSMFEDVRVRRALNHAIDRREIVDVALGGKGRPASGIWPDHQAYGGIELTYQYEPVLADALLTEAGFPRRSGEGSPDGAPSRLELVCLVPVAIPLAERIALVVQRQLNEIGVHMRLEALEDQSPDSLMAGDTPWDALLVPQPTGRTLSRLYSLWHSSEPLNIYGYSSTDAVLDALRRATTDEQRAGAARAFQRIIHDDPPAIFLVEAEQARAVSLRFHVPVDQPGQDVINTISQWAPTSSMLPCRRPCN